MNILAVIYPLIIFLSLGFNRKPWLYGLPNNSSLLKAKSTKYALTFTFMIHSIIAILWSSNLFFGQN